MARCPETRIKPTTFTSYEGVLRKHILPAFGATSLNKIRPLGVQKLLGTLTDRGLSRSRIRQAARQLLSMILNAAMDNGYIGRNPAPRERLSGKEP